MTPKRKQSGERDPQLGITKAGDGTLRRLLVQCAHHILGRWGKDSALRQWGQKQHPKNPKALNGKAKKGSIFWRKPRS